MEVRVLGSGTCDPSPHRRCAGYLLRTQGKTFLLDVGPGVHGRLAEYGVRLDTIDEIFISHFHVDHVNDLTAILFSRKNCIADKPKGPLLIHGPQGIRNQLGALLRAYGHQLDPEELNIRMVEHPVPDPENEDEETSMESEYHLGNLTVRTLPMQHSIPAIGYRFEYHASEQGTKTMTGDEDDEDNDQFMPLPLKVFTYSGDTEPCNNIIVLAKDADCLLMEASTSDNAPKTGHTTTSQAAAIANKAKVKSLLLTHISPENDETDIEKTAAQFFNGIVIAVRDGMRLTV